MTGQLLAPGSAEFAELFRTFRYSAYRLETLQSYGSSGEDTSLAAFLAGKPYQRHPGKVAWLDTVADNIAAGRTMQRVHVATEPLSDYMRYELTWAYQPNVATGEDIRVIAAHADWPTDVPRHDYWLFDSRGLYRMRYAIDDAGTWLGAEHVTAADDVAQACFWRDAALYHATPWPDYVRRRPDLAAQLPNAS
ncbi:MAG: DUF6879 family protein [Sciscionella sp.]